jgi:hypothetical protein
LSSKGSSIALTVTLITANKKVLISQSSLVLTSMLENKLKKVYHYLWCIVTLTLIRLLQNSVGSTKASYVKIA